MLLSRNRTLAPLSMVTVSNDDIIGRSDTAHDIYNFGYDGVSIYTWCTDTNDVDPYVEMGFSSPVLITAMLSSGRISHSTITNSLGMFYVSNFTLEYSPLNNSSLLAFYRTESGDPKVRKFAH